MSEQMIELFTIGHYHFLFPPNFLIQLSIFGMQKYVKIVNNFTSQKLFLCNMENRKSMYWKFRCRSDLHKLLYALFLPGRIFSPLYGLSC